MSADGQHLNIQNFSLKEMVCNDPEGCPAIVVPEKNDIAFRSKDSWTAVTSPFKILSKNARIFQSAYEDFSDSGTGPAGPNFDQLPQFAKPPSCPKVLHLQD
jgi:hypothetical protein